jgi:hypothetical protein
MLLSRPIVHTAPGRSGGIGRYLPFPVPESSPTQPVGRLERNCATIGHGYLSLLKETNDNEKRRADLVAGRREMRCNLIIDLMHML